jgi:hypothetical protein
MNLNEWSEVANLTSLRLKHLYKEQYELQDDIEKAIASKDEEWVELLESRLHWVLLEITRLEG